jgi:hypothetical protein
VTNETRHFRNHHPLPLLGAVFIACALRGLVRFAEFQTSNPLAMQAPVPIVPDSMYWITEGRWLPPAESANAMGTFLVLEVRRRSLRIASAVPNPKKDASQILLMEDRFKLFAGIGSYLFSLLKGRKGPKKTLTEWPEPSPAHYCLGAPAKVVRDDSARWVKWVLCECQ